LRTRTQPLGRDQDAPLSALRCFQIPTKTPAAWGCLRAFAPPPSPPPSPISIPPPLPWLLTVPLPPNELDITRRGEGGHRQATPPSAASTGSQGPLKLQWY
jgi:hypothetical protein